MMATRKALLKLPVFLILLMAPVLTGSILFGVPLRDSEIILPLTALPNVKTFQVFELALEAASPGANPYVDGPSFSATFRGVSGAANGKTLAAKGFWDGGNRWQIRFTPTAAGEWTYETSSSDPGLDGFSGRLVVVEPTAAEKVANPLLHGFLERDGDAWKLSDGTPFLPVGDTQWSFSEENTTAEWERWMQARQAQGFNTFMGSVWLGKYDRPEATVPAFRNGDPQTDDLQVAFFQRLDHLVQYANEHGIMMGLSIGGFPENSNWFDRFGTRERNDRWFRYVVARYSAYNIRWLLYGEANEANPPWGTTWQEEVAHSAQLVKAEDPYRHPLGNHHNFYDESSADSAEIDYVEVQLARNDTQYKTLLPLREYGKPIWSEEYWYEPEEYDGDVTLGIRNTHRNFIAALAFPTMGSLMRAHYPGFDIDRVESDPGALRMCYFARFYEGLDLGNISSASNLVSRGQAGRFGDTFAIFLKGGGSVDLNLVSIPGLFRVSGLDINSGQVTNLGVMRGEGVRNIDTRTNRDTAILVEQEARSLNFTADATLFANPSGAFAGGSAYFVFTPLVGNSSLQSSVERLCKP